MKAKRGVYHGLYFRSLFIPEESEWHLRVVLMPVEYVLAKSWIHHISVYIVAIGCLKTLHLPKYQWRNYLYFMHQVVWHFAEWQGELLWCTHTGETGEEYKSQTTNIFTTRKIEALMEKKILMADAHIGNAGRYSSFTLYNKYYFHLLSFLLSGAKVACLYYIYLTKSCFVC